MTGADRLLGKAARNLLDERRADARSALDQLSYGESRVSTFPRELDKLIARRMKELGRTLTKEEGVVVEAELFQSLGELATL